MTILWCNKLSAANSKKRIAYEPTGPKRGDVEIKKKNEGRNNTSAGGNKCGFSLGNLSRVHVR
jgi:hypothetical protein